MSAREHRWHVGVGDGAEQLDTLVLLAAKQAKKLAKLEIPLTARREEDERVELLDVAVVRDRVLVRGLEPLLLRGSAPAAVGETLD